MVDEDKAGCVIIGNLAFMQFAHIRVYKLQNLILRAEHLHVHTCIFDFSSDLDSIIFISIL